MTTIRWFHIVVFIFNQKYFSNILVSNKIGIYKRGDSFVAQYMDKNMYIEEGKLNIQRIKSGAHGLTSFYQESATNLCNFEIGRFSIFTLCTVNCISINAINFCICHEYI